MKRIVIVGSSFGGLTTAYELRRRLSPAQAEIIVLSQTSRFTFVPALPWVAMGETTVDRISFEVGPALARRKAAFFQETMRRLEPDRRVVVTDRAEHSYDFLVVATGHRSANEAVPGLGPDGGPGHSLMSPPEAVEAAAALKVFLAAPGPMVVGCAPGASCIGPAYEFALEVDHLLRRMRMRHRVPIQFLTPEPFLGHFGVGGMGGRQFLEAEFEKRDIRYVCSAALARITPEAVELVGGSSFDSLLTMAIPPLAGVEAVAATPGLANPKGFIPVDPYYRHKDHPEIFAVGVAVALPPVESTPVPVNFPKTGHMTEQMARLAAENIAAAIQGGVPTTRDLSAVCLMDLGDRAAMMFADPVRPPRNRTGFSQGRHWLWMKKLFSRYYLWSMRNGRVPDLKWVW